MVRRRAAWPRRDERGFTLVELMVVVVVVAILAAVAVPQFFKESKKVKAQSEVAAMLAELSAKQERIKLETYAYVPVTECPAPTRVGTAAATCATTWAPLGIVPTESTLRCGYTVVTGLNTDDPTTAFNVSGAAPTITSPTTTPATSWYVIQARCDIDGNGVNSYYVTSNLDSSIKKHKEGE